MRYQKCWILFCLLIASSVFAQDTIRGTYTYTFGDKESLVEARQSCKELALREAIESYAIFIESSTEVENFQVKEDLILSISTGYLKNVSIVEQNEEGRTISMTVQAFVDPEEVEELIESWKDKPTEVSDKKDEDKTVDTSGSFSDAMKLYGDRARTVDISWNNRKYDDALQQAQRIQGWLENHRPKPENRFQWYLYECFRTRSLLQQDLIRVDKLESLNNRIRARANIRLANRRADVLKVHTGELIKLKQLTERQENIRTRCVRQNHALIDRAKKKSSQFKIQ